MRRSRPPSKKSSSIIGRDFPRGRTNPWKRQKALSMTTNRRQWSRENDPIETSVQEFLTEQGDYLITETSSSSSPEYIIAE
jgi:hypothetical protein